MIELVLALPLLAPPAGAARAATPRVGARAADELAEAIARLQEVARRGDLEERKLALAALVASGDAGATPALTAEYARATARLREARDEAFRVEYALEHRRRMLLSVTARAEADESLRRAVPAHREAIEELEKELAKLRDDVGSSAPWCAALAAGTAELLGGLGTAKMRAAEKGIWQDAEKNPEPGVRLAAVELLGWVGSEGTAVGLQKLMAEVALERMRLDRELPGLEHELRELEHRLQRDMEASGGRIDRAAQATMAQYEREKRGVADMRRQVTFAAYLSDACVEAAARALAREPADVQRRSVQALERSLKKSRTSVRQRTLEILSEVPAEDVKASLRELLAREREPAVIAALLGDLATLGDEGLDALIIESYLEHESWHVERAAADALATLRSKAGIPALIERLETAEGRLRTDIRNALVSLTAQDFRTNVELWRQWWRANGADFEVPPLAAVEASAEDAKHKVGVTFFGITTESQRVLFVLDLSGSMNFTMTPRSPDDDPNRPDMPGEGEISRLAAAKRNLVTALGGLEDGARFNLVLYASDVWLWNDELEEYDVGDKYDAGRRGKSTTVEMNAESRAAALSYIETLSAVGGTNIYGALAVALEVAGATGADEWVDPEIDTIFLLSDGNASVGVTVDSDEILSYVRETNRTAGIVLHTIGLSGAHNAYLLRSLAEQNGGTYVAP